MYCKHRPETPYPRSWKRITVSKHWYCKVCRQVSTSDVQFVLDDGLGKANSHYMKWCPSCHHQFVGTSQLNAPYWTNEDAYIQADDIAWLEDSIFY